MRRSSAFGTMLALLALVAQLAFAAVVPNPEIALVLQDDSPICHAPAPPGTPAAPTHHHRVPDCAFCPLCVSLATPGIILPGTAPALPPPQVVAFRRAGLPPPATAPPSTTYLAAQPRGPPALA
ncbi:MAG TPA: hypothetical protein VMU81_30785 [Acetobacteraceae bacterium]|jgi:hypothetical protein|nr:hypothetical protein [Acetobacteraceae bacterium]